MRVNTPDQTVRQFSHTLLGGVSVIAALAAMAAAPAAIAQEVTSAETTPITMQSGVAVDVTGTGSLSVSCDGTATDDTFAIASTQHGSQISIADGGVVELVDDGCAANNIMPSTIRFDGNGDTALPTAGLITNAGTINAITGGFAITIADDVGGLVTVTDPVSGTSASTEYIASILNDASGIINGDIYMGSGGNHTFENAGTVNGTFIGAGRVELTVNNVGVMNAGSADATSLQVLDGGTEQRLVTLVNQGTQTGQMILGGGASYQITTTGTLDGGIKITQGAATNITFGQIINNGTFTAGTDGIAIQLGDGLGGSEDVSGTIFERGFTVLNQLSGELVGDVVIGDSGSHTFENVGNMTGRMSAGDGNNTITYSGGIAGVASKTDFEAMPVLVDAGEGDDTINLSGGTVAPIFSTDDPTETLTGTLFRAGDGDDTANILRGTMRGATTLLDMGDGDDTVFIAPSSFGDFIFEGDVLGGNGTDTLAVQGSDTNTPFEVTGLWAFAGFENFEAPLLEVLINLDPTGTFDVGGGTLTTKDTGVLRIRNGMDASTDQQTFATDTGAFGTATQFFGASDVINDAAMIFERPTYLTAAGAAITQGATGSMLFAVTTDGTDLTNGAALINDTTAPTNGGPAHVLLTEDSSLGLDMASKDVMGRDINDRAVDQGTFTVLVAPSIAVRDVTEDDDGNISTTDMAVTSAADLALIALADDNPFYKFAYNVDTVNTDFTRVQIIATRTPGFAQTITDNGVAESLGEFGTGLDQIIADCSDAEIGTTGSFCNQVQELGLRPDTEIVTGLLQAAPNRMPGAHRAMIDNYSRANDVISNRTALIRASTIGPRTVRHSSYNAAADDEERGMAAGSVWASHHFWMQGWGALIDQDSTTTTAGFEATNYGAVLGYDWRIDRTTLIGLYGTYGASDVEGRDVGADQVDIKGYGGGAYFNWFDRRTSAQVIVAGGSTDYEGKRIGLASSVLERDYTGWYAGFRGSADTTFATFGRMVMTPSASLQYMLNHEGDYAETGGVGAMAVKSRNGHSMQIRLADRLTAPVRMGNTLGMPYVQIAWTHEFIDNAPESKGQFVNATNAINVNAPEISIVSDSFALGVGFDLATRGGTSLSAGYEFTYDEDTTAHTGALSIRVSF